MTEAAIRVERDGLINFVSRYRFVPVDGNDTGLLQFNEQPESVPEPAAMAANSGCNKGGKCGATRTSFLLYGRTQSKRYTLEDFSTLWFGLSYA